MVAIGLRAVVPEGLFILDHEGKGVVGFTLSSGEVEAGKDARAAGERFAWLVEA